MAEVINMPRLSDTMEEGTVASWLKKVGDKIEIESLLIKIEKVSKTRPIVIRIQRISKLKKNENWIEN